MERKKLEEEWEKGSTESGWFVNAGLSSIKFLFDIYQLIPLISCFALTKLNKKNSTFSYKEGKFSHLEKHSISMINILPQHPTILKNLCSYYACSYWMMLTSFTSMDSGACDLHTENCRRRILGSLYSKLGSLLKICNSYMHICCSHPVREKYV